MMRYATKQMPCGKYTEDRVTILEDGRSSLIVVADGVGGIEFGERAAELVVSVVEKSWRELCLDQPSSVQQRLTEADATVFNSKDCGQTTAVVVTVRNGLVFGASVGDSEAWLITDQHHFALTASQHSHPYLGSGKANPVTFCREAPNGWLLVGSDGLFRRVPAWRACDICRTQDPHDACETLMQLARLPNGKFSDDVSIAVYRLSSAEGDNDIQ